VVAVSVNSIKVGSNDARRRQRSKLPFLLPKKSRAMVSIRSSLEFSLVILILFEYFHTWLSMIRRGNLIQFALKCVGVSAMRLAHLPLTSEV
jgi:hypothetical protein